MPLASDVDKAPQRYGKVPPERLLQIPQNATRTTKGYSFSRQAPRFGPSHRSRSPRPPSRSTSESRRAARAMACTSPIETTGGGGSSSRSRSPAESPSPPPLTVEKEKEKETFTKLWTASMPYGDRPTPFSPSELERRRTAKKGDWPRNEKPKLRIVYDESREVPAYMHEGATSPTSSFCKGQRCLLILTYIYIHHEMIINAHLCAVFLQRKKGRPRSAGIPWNRPHQAQNVSACTIDFEVDAPTHAD